MGECEPNWTALRKALEEEEENVRGDWGLKEVPERKQPAERAADVVRRHEE
jgi:hypothetical protein